MVINICFQSNAFCRISKLSNNLLRFGTCNKPTKENYSSTGSDDGMAVLYFINIRLIAGYEIKESINLFVSFKCFILQLLLTLLWMSMECCFIARLRVSINFVFKVSISVVFMQLLSTHR